MITKKGVKREAWILIVNLIISITAFCFLINLTNVVSAAGDLPGSVQNIMKTDTLQKTVDTSTTHPWGNGPWGGPEWLAWEQKQDSSIAVNPNGNGGGGAGTGVQFLGTLKQLPTPANIAVTIDGVTKQQAITTIFKDQSGNWATTINGQVVPIDNQGQLTAWATTNKVDLNNLEDATSASGAGGASSGLSFLTQDSIIGSALWAAAAGGAAYMVSGWLGSSANNQKAWGMAVGAGVMTWELLNPLLAGKGLNILGTQIWKGNPILGQFGASNAGLLSAGIAIGVGLLILAMMYEKTSTKTITFNCLPYEPPTGGKYCELCNQDKSRPCSEYRCRSLGQACQLLNAGTGQETCAWVNPKDVTSAEISPWQQVITRGYSYTDVKTRPPGEGMSITNTGSNDGCIKALTPITFGISTNEPTQCKIDYNQTITTRGINAAYNSMAYYFGGSNLYSYNHTQTLSLPGPSSLSSANASLNIFPDGVYTLYVRCQDANGNINEDEFGIRFCVEKGPDTTPPIIEGTSIPSGMPVQYNLNSTPIEVYVNEPADCKWSKQDRDYDLMENTMSCDQNVWDINNNLVYKCTTTLNGLENRKDNNFYFRCKDQPGKQDNERNVNTESFPFVIKGTQPLNIKQGSISPNGTVEGYADVVPVSLELETENGYNKGDATCYFSTQNIDSTFIEMAKTGTSIHQQTLNLAAGTYTYYFKCVDLGGNTDSNSTQFTIAIDRTAPVVVRAYNEGGNLKIVTDEKSTCSYALDSNQKCNFDIQNGKQMLGANETVHYADWTTSSTYYIKCTDSSGNQPNPTACSIIVKPYNQA